MLIVWLKYLHLSFTRAMNDNIALTNLGFSARILIFLKTTVTVHCRHRVRIIGVDELDEDFHKISSMMELPSMRLEKLFDLNN